MMRGPAGLFTALVVSSCILHPLSVLAKSIASTGSPHVYLGQPDGDYTPAWQSYFQVTEPLSGVSFTLPNNYAGSISVNREGHEDDTLFFWGFESQSGSLTAAAGQLSTQPWGIWLNGGPGQSSMIGLLNENGPIKVGASQSTASSNPYAWNNLMDYIWVDNPVGVGLSTADSTGFAVDENQVASDFIGFLENLVKVFPSLATRPFYISGESYAARYISYIVKGLFSTPNPPVNLAKIVVGDGAFGSSNEFKEMPSLSLIQTYPQLIGYNTEVYDYFAAQTHLCGLDINLTYPMTAHLPPITIQTGDPRRTGHPAPPTLRRELRRGLANLAPPRSIKRRGALGKKHGTKKKVQGTEDSAAAIGGPPSAPLAGRANGTVDEWYGCAIWDELLDFAVNFTFPFDSAALNPLDITDATEPAVSTDPTWFMTDARNIAALHAPKNQGWVRIIDYPWGGVTTIDPSPEPMTFLNDLAANASAHNVEMIMFSGNDDALSPHFGTEVTIQNTTFGGIQGFTEKPSLAWYDDQGNFAGVIHKERSWTYALFYGAGHEVPIKKPAQSFVFLRDFVLGRNETGLLVANAKNPTLSQTALPGELAIVTGSRTATGTYAWPTATVAAFMSHIGQAVVTGTSPVPAPSASATGKHKSAASPRVAVSGLGAAVALVVAFAQVAGLLVIL